MLQHVLVSHPELGEHIASRDQIHQGCSNVTRQLFSCPPNATLKYIGSTESYQAATINKDLNLISVCSAEIIVAHSALEIKFIRTLEYNWRPYVGIAYLWQQSDTSN